MYLLFIIYAILCYGKIKKKLLHVRKTQISYNTMRI